MLDEFIQSIQTSCAYYERKTDDHRVTALIDAIRGLADYAQLRCVDQPYATAEVVDFQERRSASNDE